MQKKPKVLFTFVEAGMGHIAPMKGICEAFTRKYGDKCEIEKSFIFEESAYPQVRKMGKSFSVHTKRTAYNKLLNKLEALSYILWSRIVLLALDIIFFRARRKFFLEFKDKNPDLVVSTYYKPSHLAKQSNKKGLTNTLIATYTPDVYVYPAWDRQCDAFIVNNLDAEKMAKRRGFKKDIVKRVPFVFRPEIEKKSGDKEQKKKDLGLENKYLVLFTSGAYGTQGTKKFLKKLLKENLEINLVVACGKNEKLVKEMSEIAHFKGDKTNLRVIGFVDNITDYMEAADLCVGKASTNTVMEVARAKTPMILNACANRVEEMAKRRFVKEKIALYEKNPKKIARLIEKDMGQKDYLLTSLSGLEKCDDLTGAQKTADILFDLLKTRFPELN